MATRRSNLPPTLTESEIQERLYGEYHGRAALELGDVRPAPLDPAQRAGSSLLAQPRSPDGVAVGNHARSASQAAGSDTPLAGRQELSAHDRPWTGQEILQSELRHLSEKLDTLRQEEQVVTHALARRARPATATSGRRVVVMTAVLLLASAVAALVVQTVGLEAQPPIAVLPGSLYSVQVAVYDDKVLADQFVQMLADDGYPAFLSPVPSRGGTPRYRVYVGRFPSKVAAQVELDRLRRHPILKDSFILQRR